MAEPSIVILDGDLREGQILELGVDFSSDILSFTHPFKKWTCFAEKNIKYNGYNGEFYYEDGKGNVYEATDSDTVEISTLIPGRLFALFEWTDALGNSFRIERVFTIYPKTTITEPTSIVDGDTATFKVVTSTSVRSPLVVWTFDDDATSITGATVSKSFDVVGYHNYNCKLDYAYATHDDGTPIIWESSPADKLTIPYSYIGFGTPVTGSAASDTYLDNISGQFLTKYDISQDLNLNVSVSKSRDGDSYAPLESNIVDESTYGLDFETGEHKLEYVELDFGDGDIRKTYEINFNFFKIFKTSGSFKGSYTVHTVHEPSNGAIYRQSLSKSFTVEVLPFFQKFMLDHMNSKIYNSAGFKDLAKAWGLQMDRLYNETQALLDSIDVEQIDNKFITSYAATYGDFPEIYEKVGFRSATASRTDKFALLKDYNFFDKLATGDITATEKQEFVNYIQSSRERLRQKGTPVSIERAIAQFAMTAKVVELWTDDFAPATLQPVRDEVFTGKDVIPKTGINCYGASSPLSDNLNQVILNDNTTPYIEINSAEINDIQYYTKTTETVSIRGKRFAVFNKSY